MYWNYSFSFDNNNFVHSLIYVGIILIVLILEVFVTDYLPLNVMLIVGLLIRVSVAILVSDFAKRQNRPPFGWAVFAFLFPPIAMIVQGSIQDKVVSQLFPL